MIIHADMTFLPNTGFKKTAWASGSSTSIMAEENLRTAFCSITLEKQRGEMKLSGKLEQEQLAHVKTFIFNTRYFWKK